MNDLVNSLKNTALSTALSVGERFTPVLTESKFKETGVLTPQEFVEAGDNLILHCPSWKWTKASEGRSKDFLPTDKQFLITNNVPCHQRCMQMAYDEKFEKIIDEGLTDGGQTDEWVDTHHYEEKSVCKNIVPDNANNYSSPQKPDRDDGDEEDDDDDDAPPVDMDNFLESGALEDADPNLYTYQKHSDPTKEDDLDANDAEIVRTRTYDIHITYDKYYQVPRFWLIGYDEQRQPLSVKQMKEDFSQDHADKTITLEAHPHIDGLTLATIHPCRHAAVMKRLIEQFVDNGKDLSVKDYLFVFLKFVQAVIPTVEYDYTRGIQL